MIELRDVSVTAGSFTLRGLSLRIEPSEYVALMGRTGSGKTTLLEAICGLRTLAGGSVHIDGREVTAEPPATRGIGYVPQDAALFPTMSVGRHLAFPLALRRLGRGAIERRVDAVAELLGLTALLDRRPAGLSGGERQRVALGRALTFEPEVLCLDEPLSALDDDTRDEVHATLERVRATTGVTTLHITHNRAEAERLADRVVVLRDGAIEL